MGDKNKNNVAEFPNSRKDISEGSVVRLKSGSFPMTVSRMKIMCLCSYFDLASGEFRTEEFYESDLELESKKVDQSKF